LFNHFENTKRIHNQTSNKFTAGASGFSCTEETNRKPSFCKTRIETEFSGFVIASIRFKSNLDLAKLKTARHDSVAKPCKQNSGKNAKPKSKPSNPARLTIPQMPIKPEISLRSTPKSAKPFVFKL
jgi:hypothetical protein